MVIKGRAATHDGKRLHPVADVEQEGKRERQKGEERKSGVREQGHKKGNSRERARRKWENTQRER